MNVEIMNKYLLGFTALLMVSASHASDLTPQQLLKNVRIDCNDPSSVFQKRILADSSESERAYTQAIIEVKNGTAIYYAGSFDETQLDEIVKLKMDVHSRGLGGGNKKYSLGIADGGKSVVFQDFTYGTEWIAGDCKVSQQ